MVVAKPSHLVFPRPILALAAIVLATGTMTGCKTSGTGGEEGATTDSVATTASLALLDSLVLNQLSDTSQNLVGALPLPSPTAPLEPEPSPESTPLPGSKGRRQASPWMALGEARLTPMLEAVVTSDRRSKKALSRALADGLRGVLSAWYKACSSDTSKRDSHGYRALCKDLSRSPLIDEIADYEVALDVVRDIERSFDMAAQRAIYFELRYGESIRQYILEDLAARCQDLPLTPDQSERIISFVRTMPRPSIEVLDEIVKGRKQKTLSVDDLAVAQRLIPAPEDVVIEAMALFETELALYRIEHLEAGGPATAPDWAISLSRSGRKSLFTDKMFKSLSQRFDAVSAFIARQGPTPENDTQRFPEVQACPAILFGAYHGRETSAYSRQYLTAAMFQAGRTLAEVSAATLITHVLKVPILDQLATFPVTGRTRP